MCDWSDCRDSVFPRDLLQNKSRNTEERFCSGREGLSSFKSAIAKFPAKIRGARMILIYVCYHLNLLY